MRAGWVPELGGDKRAETRMTALCWGFPHSDAPNPGGQTGRPVIYFSCLLPQSRLEGKGRQHGPPLRAQKEQNPSAGLHSAPPCVRFRDQRKKKSFPLPDSFLGTRTRFLRIPSADFPSGLIAQL